MSQDVFILGAGFSRAISPEMPVMADLLARLKANADYEPSDELRPALEENFEQGLSYMASGQPWLEAWEIIKLRSEFVRISRALAKTLQQSTNLAAKSLVKENYDWLKDFVRSWDTIRAGVITLNYDTLIEIAVGESIFPNDNPSVSLSAIDLYPIPLTDIRSRQHMILGPEQVATFQLYKLHGSINWWYSGREQYSGEQIYYSPVPRGFPKVFEPNDDLDVGHVVADKTPLIVPPALEKRTYLAHESLGLLWREAANHIRQARRVFCIGYSLPAADLTMIQLLRSNAQKKAIPLWVVNEDTSPQFAEHMQDCLKSSFSLNTDYCRMNSVKEFAAAYVSGRI